MLIAFIDLSTCIFNCTIRRCRQPALFVMFLDGWKTVKHLLLLIQKIIMVICNILYHSDKGRAGEKKANRHLKCMENTLSSLTFMTMIMR